MQMAKKKGYQVRISTRQPVSVCVEITGPVRLRTPAYAVVGNMHCAKDQRVWHLLEERLMFLPVTDAEIHVLADSTCSKVRFVAVNREQIVSLQEEETPLLQVHRYSTQSHE